MLLAGSPLCIAFLLIQAINKARRERKIIEHELIAGRLHLQWCCHLYRKQLARGAYFLHEHPAGPPSWTGPCVLQVLVMKGVRRIRSDQHLHGQESKLGNPIKKPTVFMSNADDLSEMTDRRCFGIKGLSSRHGGGEHQNCIGKPARRAAILYDQMCETILHGTSLELKTDRRIQTLKR